MQEYASQDFINIFIHTKNKLVYIISWFSYFFTLFGYIELSDSSIVALILQCLIHVVYLVEQ